MRTKTICPLLGIAPDAPLIVGIQKAASAPWSSTVSAGFVRSLPSVVTAA